MPRPIMPSLAARFRAARVATSMADVPAVPPGVAAVELIGAAPMDGAANEAAGAAGGTAAPTPATAGFCGGGSEPETGGSPMQPANASAASAASG